MCCTTAAVAETRIYRWVDADGVVHYSENPQVGADLVELRNSVPPPPTTQPTADEEDATGAEPTAVEAAAAPAGPTPQQIRAEKRYNCEQGRERVARIEPRTRLLEVTPGGEVREVSNDERQRRLATARKLVAENC